MYVKPRQLVKMLVKYGPGFTTIQQHCLDTGLKEMNIGGQGQGF